MLALSFSEFDPHVWSGRALQEDFVELAAAVLHQCLTNRDSHWQS
jgi:hypothetical protein